MCSGVFSESSRRCASSVTAWAITIGASSSAPHGCAPRGRRALAPDRLVGVLEADGELLDGGVLARRVDDGRGTADELGQRDQVRSVGMQGYPLELDHAADPVLVVHQLEAVVDLVERDPVRDERVDVDVAVAGSAARAAAPGRGP